MNNMEKKKQDLRSAHPEKRIVLSIYMEGWDLDCTNAHMGGSFDLGLGFKILREM